MSKQTSIKEKKKKGNRNLIILVVLLFAIVGWLLMPTSENKTSKKHSKKHYKIGAADLCKMGPRFPAKYGMEAPIAIDLRQIDGIVGLSILKPGGKSLHLKEWESAGYLGPHTIDRLGNIYVCPVPFVNLKINPLLEQNKIYKVDTDTGHMTEFMSLPWVKEPTESQPFGAIGLTFDCENNNIYCSSLAGSTRKEELGQIFEIDLKTKKILDILPNTDAIGIGIFTGMSGKRLYYASARKPDVFSIGLDVQGHFIKNDIRKEFSLLELEGGGDDKGHRIFFTKDNKMVVKGIEFSYSLMAASDPMKNVYTFSYNKKDDSWKLLNISKQ